MNFSQATYGFALSLTAQGYSQATIDIYTWALGILVGQVGDQDPAALTPQDLITFFAWLQTERNLSPASVENVWTAIRSFYNWLTIELELDARPDLHLKRPAYPPSDIQPFTQEEVQALLQACEYTKPTEGRRNLFRMRRPTALRDRALVILLLDTGLHASECSRLLVGDVDLGSGEMKIRPFGTGRKTRGRNVFLGAGACRALWRYLTERGDPPPSDPLFVTTTNNPLDRSALYHLVRALGKRANIDHVHPHRFRHTFAIQYLRNGGDVFTLQRLLGHSSLDMVRRYLALADADDQAAHKRASPVDRWRL